MKLRTLFAFLVPLCFWAGINVTLISPALATNTISQDTHFAVATSGVPTNPIAVSSVHTTQGDELLVASITYVSPATSVTGISGGGTWTKQSTHSGTACITDIWTCPETSTLSSVTVNVTLSSTASVCVVIDAFYLTAGNTSVPSISATNVVNANTSPFTGSITTVSNKDQVIAYYSTGSAASLPSIGTGYTTTGTGVTGNGQATVGEIANAYTATAGTVVSPTFTGSSVSSNVASIALNGPQNPTYTSGVINSNGTTCVLTFQVNTTPILPASGATGLTFTGQHGAITYSGATGSGSTITVTLSRAIWGSEVVTVSYSSGSGNVTDSASLALQTFSGGAITNNSTLPVYAALGQYFPE